MAGRKRVRNPASKAMIIEAAERVVARRGPSNLTLDAVAMEAGLSKGGLLYNFPSKQALIEGMIGTFVERHRCHSRSLGPGDGLPGATIRQILAAKKEIPIERGTGLAILAGLAENPDLLEPLRAEVEQRLADVEADSPDPMLAILVWLACDGLEFWKLLGISPLDEAGLARVEAYMASLVQPRDAAGGCQPASGGLSDTP